MAASKPFKTPDDKDIPSIISFLRDWRQFDITVNTLSFKDREKNPLVVLNKVKPHAIRKYLNILPGKIETFCKTHASPVNPKDIRFEESEYPTLGSIYFDAEKTENFLSETISSINAKILITDSEILYAERTETHGGAPEYYFFRITKKKKPKRKK